MRKAEKSDRLAGYRGPAPVGSRVSEVWTALAMRDLFRDIEGDKDLFKDIERDKERMLQLRKWRRERD